MSTKQVLEGALFLMEQGWSKGAFARTGDGDTTLPDDPRARSFCAKGAVYCMAQGDAEVNRVAQLALEATIGGPIITWNDRPETTISDVRMAFRRAIGSRAVDATPVASEPLVACSALY